MYDNNPSASIKKVGGASEYEFEPSGGAPVHVCKPFGYKMIMALKVSCCNFSCLLR